MVSDEMTSAEVDLIFHALAATTRRDILVRVIETEQSVSALARSYEMSLPAVQKHVSVLERAGLVTKRRRGREQLVHAEPSRISVARRLLDQYEDLMRHRIVAMDVLLAEGDPAATQPSPPTAHQPSTTH